MSASSNAKVLNARLRYADFVEFILRFERNEIPVRELYRAILAAHRVYGENYVVRRATEISHNPGKFGIRANSVMVLRYFTYLLARAFKATLRATYAEFVMRATDGNPKRFEQQEWLLDELAQNPAKFVRTILDRAPTI